MNIKNTSVKIMGLTKAMAFIIILILIGISLIAYHFFDSNNLSYVKETYFSQLNEDVSKLKTDFTPFYMRVLPDKGNSISDGYYYKIGSLVYSNNIIFFTLMNSDGTNIFVTMQSKPNAIDPNDDKYIGRVQFNANAGYGRIGKNDYDTTAALFGTDTMVFLKSNKVISDDTIKNILGAFTIKPKN